MQALGDVRWEMCDVRIFLVDVPGDPGTVVQERKMAGHTVRTQMDCLLVNKNTVMQL